MVTRISLHFSLVNLRGIGGCSLQDHFLPGGVCCSCGGKTPGELSLPGTRSEVILLTWLLEHARSRERRRSAKIFPPRQADSRDRCVLASSKDMKQVSCIQQGYLCYLSGPVQKKSLNRFITSSPVYKKATYVTYPDGALLRVMWPHLRDLS